MGRARIVGHPFCITGAGAGSILGRLDVRLLGSWVRFIRGVINLRCQVGVAVFCSPIAWIADA